MTSLSVADRLERLKALKKVEKALNADPLTDTFMCGINLMVALAEKGIRDEQNRVELATFKSRREENMARDQWRSLHQTVYDFAETLEHFVAVVFAWNTEVKEEPIENVPLIADEQINIPKSQLEKAGVVKEEDCSGDLFAEALQYHGFATGSNGIEKGEHSSATKEEEMDQSDDVLFHDHLVKTEEDGADDFIPPAVSTAVPVSAVPSKRRKLAGSSAGSSAATQRGTETAPNQQFSCDACSQSFESEMLRTLHVFASHKEKVKAKKKNTEQEVLAHPCGLCPKTFTAKSKLKEHQATHVYKVLGDRPHKCDQCTRTFGTSSMLKHHQRTKHGVKPHECEECKERFAFQEELRNHRIGKHRKF